MENITPPPAPVRFEIQSSRADKRAHQGQQIEPLRPVTKSVRSQDDHAADETQRRDTAAVRAQELVGAIQSRAATTEDERFENDTMAAVKRARQQWARILESEITHKNFARTANGAKFICSNGGRPQDWVQRPDLNRRPPGY